MTAALTTKDAAFLYASRKHWHVFPVEPRGKAPIGALVPHGKDDASDDLVLVNRWFPNGHDRNIGIACRPSRVIVIDIDPRHGGAKTFAKLEAELGTLPATATADTGGAGVHYVFVAPDDAIDLVGKLGDGVDLIRNGYIVAAPSVHPSGGVYRWREGRAPDQIAIAELPASWLAFATRRIAEPARSRPVEMPDDLRVRRARSYLAKMTASVAGDHGHDRLWDAACRLVHGFDLDDATAEHLLVADFNPRCDPPWSERDIARKVHEAREKADPARWQIEEREPPRANGAKVSNRGEDYRLPAGLTIVDGPDPDRVQRADTPAASEVKRTPVAILAADVARLDTPPIRSYSTGLPDLDALIGGGISTRQIATVLAPPGAGKSGLATSTAVRIEPTLPVLYACTELEQHELMSRFAANILNRSWSAIDRGQMPKELTIRALEGRRFYLIGSERMPRDGSKALELIEQEARRIADEHGVPPLVIVDYLQDLVRGSERDIRSRTGDLTTELRAVAQRLDCPMLVVSSVSRAFYSPRKAAELRGLDDPTVYLAAAKESGDVDYASAVVAFLDVDEDRTNPERPARIAVAKSRHGQPGFAGARFDGASGRWTSDPSAVGALSAQGRADREAADSSGDADTKVLATVVRMYAKGERELATASQIKSRAGIGSDRVRPALDRLVHAGRLRLVDVDRDEGGKTKARQVYEPTSEATS